MKTIAYIILACMLLMAACTTQKALTVQDYQKVNGKWIPLGQPHILPDSVTTVHIYSWMKGKHIYAY
jgi:hypothetical protein